MVSSRMGSEVKNGVRQDASNAVRHLWLCWSKNADPEARQGALKSASTRTGQRGATGQQSNLGEARWSSAVTKDAGQQNGREQAGASQN